MKQSIYIRNFIATALIVLISFTMLGGLSTAWNYRRSLVERRSTMGSALHETARYVTTAHVYDGMELNSLNLSMWLSMVSGISGFDLLVTNAEGVVDACSDREFRSLGQIIPESALALSARDPGAVSRSTLGGIYHEMRQVAGAPLAVGIDGEPYVFGYIFVSIDIESSRQEWRQFTSVFMLIAFNVMALAFVISYFMTKRQAEPLNEIASAVRRFARGDLSTRVKDVGRQDEIGHLSQAFNAMADSLEGSETLRRDFIANISHELKTPMTVIAGFADGILDGTIQQENEERYLGVISSETRRLSRLVQSMLEMSKLQSLNVSAVLRQSFDLPEVVRLALLSLESKILMKNLDVDAEMPEEPIMTLGDKDSITQVVYNLLDNAIKFSAPHGLIRLELWKQGEKAYISVENSGETIPPHELPVIFERFHKTDKSRSLNRDGVGLGLYIVKTILDSHNEDIYVTSDAGVTKFMFTLTIDS